MREHEDGSSSSKRKALAAEEHKTDYLHGNATSSESAQLKHNPSKRQMTPDVEAHFRDWEKSSGSDHMISKKSMRNMVDSLDCQLRKPGEKLAADHPSTTSARKALTGAHQQLDPCSESKGPRAGQFARPSSK